MQLTQILTAIALTVLASTEAMAQTVTYRGYASTVQCSGSNFFCQDNGGICCSFPAGFGFSAQFENLPGGTQGQGYTGSTCSAFLFAVFGPGTKCWNGGGARATHLNWFHSAGRREVSNGEETDCATPNGFSYHDDKGVERVIKVPAATNASEVIAQHFVNKDWKALQAYETL